MSERKKASSTMSSPSSHAMINPLSLDGVDVSSTHSSTSGDVDYSQLIRNRNRLSQIARRPLPIRTTIAAAILLTLGIIFIILGIIFFFNGTLSRGDRGLSLLILGGISSFSSIQNDYNF